MKKHLIWAAASAALLASCAKEETQTFTPAATDLPQASITFVAEENADFTRAFFDNTTDRSVGAIAFLAYRILF